MIRRFRRGGCVSGRHSGPQVLIPFGDDVGFPDSNGSTPSKRTAHGRQRLLQSPRQSYAADDGPFGHCMQQYCRAVYRGTIISPISIPDRHTTHTKRLWLPPGPILALVQRRISPQAHWYASGNDQLPFFCRRWSRPFRAFAICSYP